MRVSWSFTSSWIALSLVGPSSSDTTSDIVLLFLANCRVAAQRVAAACLCTYAFAEVYSAGVALTQRCLLAKGAGSAPHDAVNLFAVGGSVQMLKLEAWTMMTMWQPMT